MSADGGAVSAGLAKSLRNCLIVAWACAALAGWAAFARVMETPAVPVTVPTTLPADALPDRGPGVRVVVFAHPGCPCTRATASELARSALAWPGTGVYTDWIVTGPAEMPQPRSVDRDSTALPGLIVTRDTGETAARFGVCASGHVLVYDATGALAYSGGVTAGRGHAGGNAGLRAVEAAVRGDVPLRDVGPVYGCPLFDDESASSAIRRALASNTCGAAGTACGITDGAPR